ncbi:SGNH/GDSL hydrolase family protein [Massilia sp. YMA4]|uniref:SGNH/GDSL hydrolase family protein n=1 Tax=Massilia sp. YMA4 TaxID=1593482 RepID=UPI000DD13D76|nr:SGNH/GDSL hydrolase family protein [Massilia sp. YMA4]AXA92398.1 SGNH/GDSL hydrolase family protein [Massilia sp. YMA4]
MFRSYFGAALAVALFAGGATAAEWRTSWYAAPQPAWQEDFALPTNVPAHVTGQTVREVLRLSVGGQRLRVVLSNRYGTVPLVVGAASIARPAGAAGTIDGASSRQLTFAGRTRITIPPGHEATSDTLTFRVTPRARLAVSAWYPEQAALTTFHWGAQQTGYIATGNATTAATLPASRQLSGRAFVSAVHVEGSGATVVAFGDSITDGNGSTPDRDRRWPDALAERLPNVAVANAGISGARLLSSKMGVRAAERFGPDVLEQPGVTAVVLLIGINDIGWPGTPFAPADAVPTAAQLIAGYRELIALARSRGVRVIGGTLLPFRGALASTPFEGYWRPAKEAVRQQVNTWIRDGGEFDAVADFDAALRDPGDSQRMLPAYDSGDHLHPGDAGYTAMAQVVARK